MDRSLRTTGAQSEEGKGWSLWVKQLWENTNVDSPLGAQVGDGVGLQAREELGRRWRTLAAWTDTFHGDSLVVVPPWNLTLAPGRAVELTAEQANSCLSGN